MEKQNRIKYNYNRCPYLLTVLQCTRYQSQQKGLFTTLMNLTYNKHKQISNINEFAKHNRVLMEKIQLTRKMSQQLMLRIITLQHFQTRKQSSSCKMSFIMRKLLIISTSFLYMPKLKQNVKSQTLTLLKVRPFGFKHPSSQ